VAQQAKRPTPAINIMKIFEGVRSALCVAKLMRRDPLSKMPAKPATHKNIPITCTVAQLIGVGRLQNRGSSGDRSLSLTDESFDDDILNDSHPNKKNMK